jgi:mono/diheme cytochrome c family protein
MYNPPMPAADPLACARWRASPRAVMLLTMAALSLAATFGRADDDVPTLSEGLFSAAQVERGERVFLDECMECHELPEFTAAGAYFEEQIGETVWSVFEFIWSEMPEDRPAWLDPDEYADVLAYLLSVYGFSSGPREMPIERDALEQVTIEAPPSSGS